MANDPATAWNKLGAAIMKAESAEAIMQVRPGERYCDVSPGAYESFNEQMRAAYVAVDEVPAFTGSRREPDYPRSGGFFADVYGDNDPRGPRSIDTWRFSIEDAHALKVLRGKVALNLQDPPAFGTEGS